MRKVFTLGMLLVALHAEAQENFFYLNWDINQPLSNRAWLSNTSVSGGKMGYRAFLNNRRISIGADFNWTMYDEYAPEETFQHESGATTTDYFKYLYQYGLTVSSQYYFPVGDSEHFFPYAGVGLGANYNRYTMYYNIYTQEEKAWGFLARPEAGILVRLGTRRSLGLMAAVHYDYSTNKSELYNYDRFTSWGFQIGAMFMNR